MKEDIYNYLEKFEEQTKQRFCAIYINLFMKVLREILMKNCGLNYLHFT